DHLVDDVGNALDGESDAAEPAVVPIMPHFPSGDGQPGGDFGARFTVDSRPEVGTWAAGTVYVDTNGNTSFDPTNLDYVNRDIIYAFGQGSAGANGASFASDDFFAGNFALGAAADGFDKLAAYGSTGPGISGGW